MSQLRELALEPKGHARHRDHERGFDMSRAEEEYALTTVSLSFPISRNDGKSISSAPGSGPVEWAGVSLSFGSEGESQRGNSRNDALRCRRVAPGTGSPG